MANGTESEDFQTNYHDPMDFNNYHARSVDRDSQQADQPLDFSKKGGGGGSCSSEEDDTSSISPPNIAQESKSSIPIIPQNLQVSNNTGCYADAGLSPPAIPPNSRNNYGELLKSENCVQQQLGKQEPSAYESSPNVENDRKQSKFTRPFKAYPRDPVSLQLGYYGMPGLPVQGPLTDGILNQTVINSDDSFNQFRKQMLEQQALTGRRINTLLSHARGTPKSTNGSSNSNSPIMIPQQNVGHPVPTSTNSDISGSSSESPDNRHLLSNRPLNSDYNEQQQRLSPVLNCTLGGRKRGRSDEETKDEAYWERRRKNNEAAKRSRDARRAKEDEIAIRAAFLEQENLKLRIEVAALKNETAKLRCMLYNS